VLDRARSQDDPVAGQVGAQELEDVGRQSPDLILHGGDLAVIGPRPAQAIDLLRDRRWAGVLGNTDEILFDPSGRAEQERRAPKLGKWLNVLFDTLTPWARNQLNDEQVDWLRSLPRELRREEFVLVHAAPDDLWRAPMPDASDEQLDEVYGRFDTRLAVYGHIHRPYVRRMDRFTIANTGSVGLPYDGDWRPSYLLVDDGSPTVRRVEYDVDRACRDLVDARFPLAGWLEKVLRSGHFVQP
jgi:diadenosine tetraphosphatase ApaH/serine/threonine PP2A family protein phosphatase